jgi:hypothetical protein
MLTLPISNRFLQHNRSASSEDTGDRTAIRPGEYPYYQFRAPFPPPIDEKSEECRDKYLLGDWWAVCSKLAGRGIKLALLLISDLTFAKTRFICVFNNFACLSPTKIFEIKI